MNKMLQGGSDAQRPVRVRRWGTDYNRIYEIYFSYSTMQASALKVKVTCSRRQKYSMSSLPKLNLLLANDSCHKHFDFATNPQGVALGLQVGATFAAAGRARDCSRGERPRRVDHICRYWIAIARAYNAAEVILILSWSVKLIRCSAHGLCRSISDATSQSLT